MSAYRLGIVIPAYNEEDRLPLTLEAIAQARHDLAGRVVIEQIDIALNGTTDGTAVVAREAAERLDLPLEVVECPDRGKAAALAYAMPRMAGLYPDLDGVLFMDADNATDLSQIAAFDLADRGAIWIASRKAPGSQIIHLADPSPAREVMSAGMRLLTRVLLGLRLSDTQCGFKLIPTRLVAPLFGQLRSRSWVFDAELLSRAQRAGITVREAPIRWVEMDGSKVRPIHDTIGSVIGLAHIWLWLR